MVVDAEVNETNKTTLWSEPVGVLAREKKGDKKIRKDCNKDLTEPTLLEMPPERQGRHERLVVLADSRALARPADDDHGSRHGGHRG